MREIKFRAKRLSDGKWLYGDHFTNRGMHYITADKIISPFAAPEDFQVDPKTLGQYTGTVDSDGEEIWEGDIIELLTETKDEHKYLAMAFIEEQANFSGVGSTIMSIIEIKTFYKRDHLVIGNVHDNPGIVNHPQ